MLKFLEVDNCSNLTYLLTPSMTLGLVQLHVLKVTKCTMMEQVITGGGAEETFPLLNTILLESCFILTSFYEGSSRLRFSSLKQITVADCPKLLTFASSFSREQGKEMTANDKGNEQRPELPTQPFFSEKVAFANLEELELSWINVNTIWHTSITSSHVAKLTKLIIEGCNNLEYLFPSSIALGLVQLCSLKVTNCAKMEQVITGEGAEDLFPKLFTIILESCPNLKSLAAFASSFSSDQKKEITTDDTKSEERNVIPAQPFFSDKVAFANLEELELSWINVNTIWHASITSSHVAKLTKLIVEGCGNLEYLFPSSIALGLVQLYSLKVTNCAKMEQVIKGEGAEDLFPKLFTVILESCPNLKCFYEGNSRLEFPRLYEITVVNCLALAAFASSFSSDQKKEITTNDIESEERHVIPTQPFFSDKVGLPSLEELQLCWINVNIKWDTSITSFCFKKLKKLIIQGFDNLEFLFSSCVARDLVMLERLEIRECKRMRGIIVTKNAEEKENLIFRQLNYLWIKDLQNLVGFYLGNCIVEFPSLKDLEVLNCPELEGLTVKYFESTSCIADIQTLFNEQVTFLNLEWLTITHLKNLEMIWHNKLYADSFCRLKSLTVENCEKLSTVFSSTDILGKILKSLEVLSVYQCGSLEGIFEIAEFNVKPKHAVIDTKFRELNIKDLPRLKHVWNNDPQGMLTFHNLESVEVSHCGSLKILFPTSIGKSLLQLQKLHLYRCGVEEIVTMGEQEAKAIVSFEFPQVTSLKLEALPRLQCFYPRKHTTMWPMLKEFYVSHFNRVKSADRCGQLDFPVRLPLFSTKKV
ncbi:hypothetical protein SLEP1_g51966 [Rubroshorea leprosula]|uniref:Disease resistance protein At4g27190-like leucine-rich repeats domain-containing protein n=1 Tax=Rubroshorea leprosula TaxID=152421 RepID=A0AAV5M4X2_9ROSI|nr:hypothetical protein SLEP1_g51966 [Rubroshorea leprosula]